MGNLEAAKESLRQCLNSPAKSAEAVRYLAAIALEQQDYEQALTLHKQLVELEEPASGVLYNLALLYQRRGRPAGCSRAPL